MPSRLWLDATDPEGARVLHQHHDSYIPPVPALPNGINSPPIIPPRLSTGTGETSQRHSLPTKRSSRKTKDDTKQIQKSPEVISNLIDSLADIQFPDPIEGESRRSPKPVVLDQELRHVRSFDALNGLSQKEKAKYQTLYHDEDEDIDIAAPPVVKTSKSSVRNADQKKSSHVWENALGISALSNPSNPSLLSLGSQESLVNVSTRKRGKTTASKDSLKNKSPLINSTSFGIRDASGSTTTSSKKEGKKPIRTSGSTTSPLIESPSVPDRRSSKQFATSTPKSNLSASTSPVIESSSTFVSRFQENKKSPSPELMVEPKTLLNFDLEDTEVTKRIKELKARKEQREREARLLPQVTLDANGLPTTLQSITNGDTRPPKVKKSPPPELKLSPASTTNPRPHTGASSRPITPISNSDLPIDYSFVVKSLENRPVSSQAAPTFVPPETPKSVQRPTTSHSRSGLSRSLISKSLFGGRRDSSVSSTSRKKKERQSIETHHTEPALPVSNQQSRSNSVSGRKRWSISGGEVANHLERRASLKTAPAGPPNRFGIVSPTMEEPSLQDDIDAAVDRFLKSNRLTQKIKDPATGRVISFSEVGSKKGNVVFCCVGMGITRYATAFYDELAATLNLRIITPDRPGVGESEANPLGSPLSWAAGAIYALATALRIPQHIRGKVHLLAPWIPPSQMQPVGTHQDSPPTAQLPRSQRFLRALPATLLRITNSSFLSATTASLSPNVGNNVSKRKRKSDQRPLTSYNSSTSSSTTRSAPTKAPDVRPESLMLMDSSMPSDATLAELAKSPTADIFPPTPTVSSFNRAIASTMSPHARSSSAPVISPMSPTFPIIPSLENPDARKMYDECLTSALWKASTANANPYVDLVVCLEHKQPIGFRYVDITRAVVIHHGAKDTRVPVENVKWLGNAMRRCEVRVLEGEGHSLMASASVIGSVLQEMSKEWEEWAGLVSKGRGVVGH